MLKDKVAIVTGASRGLGKDIAAGLAGEGCQVVVAARTEQDGESKIPGTLAGTVAEIEAAGGKATAIRCDVANEEDIAALVAEVISKFGRIDILVNNAGILVPGAVMEMEPRHWRLSFRVNVEGPFMMCRAAVPHMREGGGGHIINISSRAAVFPGPGPYKPGTVGGTAYGSTKAAVERFTQGLAGEVQAYGISVNALSPQLPIWSEGGHYFRTRSGEPGYSGWRMSGRIMADAAITICETEPAAFTGNILYDDLVMANQAGLSAEELARRYPVES